VISTLFNLACLFDLSYIKFLLIEVLLAMSFINVDKKRVERKEKNNEKNKREKRYSRTITILCYTIAINSSYVYS